LGGSDPHAVTEPRQERKRVTHGGHTYMMAKPSVPADRSLDLPRWLLSLI
jgi:hypothetical protein